MRVKDPDIGSPAKKSMSSVTDIEVVDSHTVKMKLNTSFADFFYWLFLAVHRQLNR